MFRKVNESKSSCFSTQYGTLDVCHGEALRFLWNMNLICVRHLRQNKDWKQFLWKGGTVQIFGNNPDK
jgi:hypothetical protein